MWDYFGLLFLCFVAVIFAAGIDCFRWVTMTVRHGNKDRGNSHSDNVTNIIIIINHCIGKRIEVEVLKGREQ